MERLFQSKLFHRFWAIAGAVSIRVKVLGIVLGVILLLGLFVTVQMRDVLWRTLNTQLELQGVAIADSIAQTTASLLESGNPEALRAFLRERQQHYSNESHNTSVSYLFVTDASGDVVAHTFEEAVPASLLEDPVNRRNHHHTVQMEMAGGSVIDIAAPLPDDDAHVRIGLAEGTVAATVDGVTRQLILITALMIAVGFAAAIFLTWILTRPILDLVDVTRAVAQGDFSRRVPRWADDEIGDLAEAFNSMTAALAQADHERSERENLRAQYISGVILAQEEERKRIARELHDSTSQSLTSLLLGLRNLEDTTEVTTWQKRLEALRGVVSETLDEVHNIAWQLRPSVLDDLGLSSALERYITDQGRCYDIQIDFIMHGCEERLPLEMETTIYRVVQEAITNVVRHADASTASVLIDQRDRIVRIIVEDDGVGFDPESVKGDEQSLGLQGIRERARLFGGKLTIESGPGQGTSLFIEMPVNESLNNNEPSL